MSEIFEYRYEYKEAITVLSDGINQSPGFAELYYYRGMAESLAHDSIGALSDCNNLVGLNPAVELNPAESPLCYYYSGMIKSAINDSVGAFIDYDKAISLIDKSNDIYDYCLRGEIKLTLKDYNGAILDFDKAIKEKITIKNEAFFYRGKAEQSLKNFKKAISDYNKAIILDPEYAEAFYSRGLLRIESGQIDKGCLDLNKAYSLRFSRALEAINKYCK